MSRAMELFQNLIEKSLFIVPSKHSMLLIKNSLIGFGEIVNLCAVKISGAL